MVKLEVMEIVPVEWKNTGTISSRNSEKILVGIVVELVGQILIKLVGIVERCW